MSGPAIYISGIGMHPFGKHPEKTLKELAAHAALAALDDAGISPVDIDAAFCANAYAGLLTGQESIRGETWLRTIGIGGVPIFNIENACASGGSAAHTAYLAVASGQYATVLVVGAEKMCFENSAHALKALASSSDIELTGGIGLQFAAVDAIRVMDLMDQEDLNEDALVWVTVKNHANAIHNPMAQFRKGCSAEEVRASRLIADPIRLLMCSAISDGAAAIVITSKRPLHPVRILASAVRSSPFRIRDGDQTTGALVAGEVYQRAGLGPEDIDVAEVHDAVAPGELLAYRELGFCKSGEIRKFVDEEVSALGGTKPVNPSGGLNSRGHPVGATGIAQLVELTLQLRGAADKRQVEGARTALAHNAGGWIGEDPAVCAAHILQRET